MCKEKESKNMRRRKALAEKKRRQADSGRALRKVREETEASVQRLRNPRPEGNEFTPAEKAGVESEHARTGRPRADLFAALLSRKHGELENMEHDRTARLRERDANRVPPVAFVRPGWTSTTAVLTSVGGRVGIVSTFDAFLVDAAKELHRRKHEVGSLDDPVYIIPELTRRAGSNSTTLVDEIEFNAEWNGVFVKEYSLVTVVRAALALRGAVRGDFEDDGFSDEWCSMMKADVVNRCASILGLLQKFVPVPAYEVVCVRSDLPVVDVYGSALDALVVDPDKIDFISNALFIGYDHPMWCEMYGCGQCDHESQNRCLPDLVDGPLKCTAMYKLFWDNGLCDAPGCLQEFLEVKRETRRLIDVRRVDDIAKQAHRDLDLPKAYRFSGGAIAGPPTVAESAAMIEEARDHLYRLRVCCVDDLYVTDLNPVDGEADVEEFTVAGLHAQLPHFFDRLAMKDEEYPNALMRQYRIQTYYPDCDADLHGLVLSPRGVCDPGDGSGLQLSVCHACVRSLRSSQKVPALASANHFLIGCIREHFRLENIAFEPTEGDIKVTTPVYNHAYIGRIFNDPKGHVMMQGHSFLEQVSIVSHLKNFPRRTDDAMYKFVMGGALTTDEGWKRRLVDPLMVSPCAWTIAEFFAQHNPRFNLWQGHENPGTFATYPSPDGLVDIDSGKEQYTDSTGGPALDVAHESGRDSCPQTTSIRIGLPEQEPLVVSLQRALESVKKPVVDVVKPADDCDGME